MSLWNFGHLALPFHHGLASFADNERRNNLGLFIQCLLELELELASIMHDSPNLREQLEKFLNCKVFGSFE